MNDDIYARTTRNRLEIADFLESLPPGQWTAETLCKGWTVRHMAGHFVQPMLISFGRFFLTSIRYRGNTAATANHFARTLANRAPTDLISLLRQHALDRLDPPRVGPIGPFAETCIHLRDIARPLNLEADARQEDWLTLLRYLTGDRVAPALLPAGRLDGLRLVATDADWQHGNGAAINGTMEALTMAITGRQAALHDLEGPGVETLRDRIV